MKIDRTQDGKMREEEVDGAGKMKEEELDGMMCGEEIRGARMK